MNALTAFGGLLQESYNYLNGDGFDSCSVYGALKDGYNGEGDGFGWALSEDVLSFGLGTLGALVKVGVATKGLVFANTNILKVGDILNKSQKGTLKQIWSGDKQLSALPKSVRNKLAKMYLQVARRNPLGSGQRQFQRARAAYLRGKGPNPGSSGTAFMKQFNLKSKNRM